MPEKADAAEFRESLPTPTGRAQSSLSWWSDVEVDGRAQVEVALDSEVHVHII